MIMKLQIEFPSFPSKVGWSLQEKEYPLYGHPSKEELRTSQRIKEVELQPDMSVGQSEVIAADQATKNTTKEDLVKKT